VRHDIIALRRLVRLVIGLAEARSVDTTHAVALDATLSSFLKGCQTSYKRECSSRVVDEAALRKKVAWREPDELLREVVNALKSQKAAALGPTPTRAVAQSV